MTDEKMAHGLMLQVRRRKLTPDESRWLSNYRAGNASALNTRRKKSSLLPMWVLLCGFIGAGVVQILTMVHPETLKVVSQWAETILG